MSERKAYEALSSESRLEILKLLHKKPLSVDEIAKLADLQPVTIRQHLRSLEDTGFVESFREKGGSVGRPKIYYQIAEEPTRVDYPKRSYQTLSKFMIRTLRSLIGARRAGKLLKRVGKNMGENEIRKIGYKYDVRDWSPEAFIEYFIKGYLEEAGAEPEIVKSEKNLIVYRVYNCLFLELAVKMPEMMCEVLHDAFHEGVTSAMDKKAKITRITCKGHGDPYCEHKCEWKEPSAERT